MTDNDQIKCKYKIQNREYFNGKPYCTCFSELCEDLPICDDNCQIYEDFKQLACMTQEYEEYKKLAADFKDVNKQLGYKYLTIKKECEDLKEKNALLESQMAFNLSEMGIRLGNEVNRSETLLKELKRFDKIKDEYREMSEKLKFENIRYHKALKEIEEYLDAQQKYFDGEDYHNLLDIINKARGNYEE